MAAGMLGETVEVGMPGLGIVEKMAVLVFVDSDIVER